MGVEMQRKTSTTRLNRIYWNYLKLKLSGNIKKYKTNLKKTEEQGNQKQVLEAGEVSFLNEIVCLCFSLFCLFLFLTGWFVW